MTSPTLQDSRRPADPSAGAPDRPPGRPPRRAGAATAQLVKITLLAGVAAVALYAAPKLYDAGHWAALGVLAAAVGATFWIYLSPRRLPAKYLLPATALFLAFVAYPVLYIVAVSFTDYGDGHLLTKDQAVRTLVDHSAEPVPDSPAYTLTVATGADGGPLVLLLTDPATGQVSAGTARGLAPAPAGTTTAPDGRVTAAPGLTVLTFGQINGRAGELKDLRVPVDGGFIVSQGLSTATTARPVLVYDRQADTLTDTRDGTVYQPRDGWFTATDGSGRTLPTGWHRTVGFANFTAVLTSPAIRGPFLGVLAWTFGFALLSTGASFALGLGLALTLHHPRLRGQRAYRSLLLLPYAMPAFIGILIWQSMYNRDFGLLNQVLHTRIDWLGDPWNARFAVLLTSLWLGFPNMLLICTGVLQAMPAELNESARIDGAGPWTAFRAVTFPLLLVAAAPVLISSFAFNFNNFNAIQLLTGGGPFDGAGGTAGSTDILISYTYRLAFGGQGAQYGFAAALSIVIFLLVGLITLVGFRRTRALEELNA
ncbi:ABC transporter permease subunit [Kitasatospora sp. NPDC088351]|uniref:ABC transporter permease subunit n=1 Tax=unclassified Kitasatospora TaxID=2633591 RepID=UPI0034291589